MMRHAGEGVHGARMRGLIVVLWRAGLRIAEAMNLAERDLDPSRGALLVVDRIRRELDDRRPAAPAGQPGAPRAAQSLRAPPGGRAHPRRRQKLGRIEGGAEHRVTGNRGPGQRARGAGWETRWPSPWAYALARTTAGRMGPRRTSCRRSRSGPSPWARRHARSRARVARCASPAWSSRGRARPPRGREGSRGDAVLEDRERHDPLPRARPARRGPRPLRPLEHPRPHRARQDDVPRAPRAHGPGGPPGADRAVVIARAAAQAAWSES